MFSRRHPFLFFLLVFSGITATAVVATGLIVAIGLRRPSFESGEKVGIIEIRGMISDSKEVLEDLKKFRLDNSIRAVVLRIDSPGGVVGPSQEIHREVVKCIARKPVIASMGAVAASGGYYVAAGASGIVASPGTVTGSIGVVIGYTNFRELLGKIGLKPVVIKSGTFKDIGSPARQMTDEEKALLQAFVDQTHRQFVSAVAEGRKMDPAAVERIADGRIYTGEQARDLGLVDRLGNLEDAVEWAGRLGGVKGPVTAVYARKKKRSLLRYLTESVFEPFMQRAVGTAPTPAYLYRNPEE